MKSKDIKTEFLIYDNDNNSNLFIKKKYKADNKTVDKIKNNLLDTEINLMKSHKTLKNLLEKDIAVETNTGHTKTKDIVTAYSVNKDRVKKELLKTQENIKDQEHLKEYYNYLLLLLNDKKVDPTAYKIVSKSKYDLDELVNNEKFLTKIRNDFMHNIKTESTSDQQFINTLLSKYNNQITKGDFKENLNYYSDRLNIKPAEMAKRLKLSLSTVSDWYNGVNFPRPDKINALANELKIPPEYLTRPSEQRLDYTMTDVSTKKDEKSVKIPVLGSIPAGIPNEAIEYIEDWEEIPAAWVTSDKEYFALKIKGTSMYPKYMDGDIVIFQRVSNCDSGKNCAVLIDNTEVTFKKLLKTEAGLILQPLNDKVHEPLFFSNKQILEKNIKVIGVPKEIRRQAD